jgi:integrase
MCVYKRGNVWWYRFTWNAEAIRESTKQTNKRVAEQIEAAHKTSLAKGEVGIRDRVKVPTLKDFIQQKFSPYIEARFLSKNNTLEYYRAGMKNLTGFVRLANCRLDKITVQDIAAFVRTRRDAGLQVTSVNRQLEVLRRIFKLAEEWNETEKRLPRVEMLGGERHRDRVLSPDEEDRYLEGAAAVGVQVQDAYFRALGGIRARLRGKEPIEPKDPFLLRDAATILIDCALRPEECFRLRWGWLFTHSVRENGECPPGDSAERSGVALNGVTQAYSDL